MNDADIIEFYVLGKNKLTILAHKFEEYGEETRFYMVSRTKELGGMIIQTDSWDEAKMVNGHRITWECMVDYFNETLNINLPKEIEFEVNYIDFDF